MAEDLRIALNWQATQRQDWNPYLTNMTPSLSVAEIDLLLLKGDERHIVSTPTTGDYTLMLQYKRREGAVTSFEDRKSDLVILQLQGARSSKSYRLTSGLKWIEVFADQAISIAEHPLTPFQRVLMPPLHQIEGTASWERDIREKYARFRSVAMLRHSEEEQMYVRDIKKTH